MKTPKQQIEESVRELGRTVCNVCKGDGFTSEHDPSDTRPEHFENGDCHSCPVQVQCDYCHGEGKLATLDDVCTSQTKLLEGVVATLEKEQSIHKVLAEQIVLAEGEQNPHSYFVDIFQNIIEKIKKE